MRIIAAVTLVFLPGTFTATLFGTMFFSFSNKSTSRVVSWWIWLYFVVTVVLTLTVLIGWYCISRREKSTMLQSLNIDPEKGGSPVMQTADEGSMLSEKQSLEPGSAASPSPSSLARRTTSIGRIAEVDSYMNDDWDARMRMSGIAGEWHPHQYVVD
jgi:hypothetical protein